MAKRNPIQTKIHPALMDEIDELNKLGLSKQEAQRKIAEHLKKRRLNKNNAKKEDFGWS